MLIQNQKKAVIDHWVWGFILIHVLIWSLVPALVRCNLAMDAMEGTTWGHEMQWGYDKNPFMNAWLTEGAIQLGGPSGWATYLVSQLSVAICFWAVFQIGKKMMSSCYALIAVGLLEGLQYYNFHAIDLSDNTLELSTWALTILFFFRATSENQLKDWVLTGCFAAFALLTKYYSLVLLASMFLYLIMQAPLRNHFKERKLYIGGLVFLMFLTPHLIWLYHHDFITLHYMFQRIDARPSPWNHLFFPLQFAWQQFEVILPGLFLLGPLIIGHGIFSKRAFFVAPRNRQFLYYIGAGPFLLTVLLSFVTGIKLRAGWGMPLFSLYGLMLMMWTSPRITHRKFYYFLIFLFSFLIINVVIYSAAFLRAADTSSAIFPGKQIATDLTTQWHQQFKRPLRFVAGTRWIAGNVALYSKDRPSVLIDWDWSLSPWIDENQLKKSGAVFVWEETAKEKIDWEKIKAKYPILNHAKTLHYAWRRNPSLPPIDIQVAWVAPEALNPSIAHG